MPALQLHHTLLSALLATNFLAVTTLQAEDFAESLRGALSLDLVSSSSLPDLRPAAGGSFDRAGVGISGALHWPVRHYSNSDLLLGIDGAVMTTDSSTPGLFTELTARHMILGPSLKWMFGNTHRYSLDAGIGLHLLDIVEVDSSYAGPFQYYDEIQYWEDSTVAPFIGATWDFNAARPDKFASFSMAVKVHFVDFEVVRDENSAFLPLLGPNAGALSGTVVVLQFGAAMR